jgi:bifunctional non-homologous end joining protein LigD
MPKEDTFILNSHTVRVTHADKILFPEDGITKSELAAYYARIAPAMLPHLRGRPLTMHRFPRGIDHEGFFHKEAPAYFPPWIRRVTISLRGGESQEQIVCEHEADIVYLSNQNCIDFHVWLSRQDRLNNPDRMVFDLDPPESDLSLAPRAARILRGILEEIGVTPHVLSTGSRGIHVVVPLVRNLDFDRVRAIAAEIAGMAVQTDPERFTMEQRIEKRGERLYFDVNRNAYVQTAVAPYSVRALPGAPVAAPLDWDELKGDEFDPRRHTIRNIFARLERKGDLWEDIDRGKVSLDAAAERLAALAERK